MACVTHIVTNMELVEVHNYRFFYHPLKELPAGEGLTLFGTLMTSYLAGFHNIKTILLCKHQTFFVKLGFPLKSLRACAFITAYSALVKMPLAFLMSKGLSKQRPVSSTVVLTLFSIM